MLVIAPQANRLAVFQACEGSLFNRLRGTDVAGYFSDEKLAVLLTDTDHEGALAFAKVIIADCDLADNIELNIYAYPTLPEEVLLATESKPRQDSSETTNEKESDGDSSTSRFVQPLFTRSLPTWKRTIDVVASCAGLMILAPLFAIVAATIKLTSKGPVFFRQLRTGHGGVPFVIYKFRTMYVDAEERKTELLDQNEQDGPAFKIKNDPRITAIGAYLRRSCLDELPQLWNVLRGEMTLVGPRPLPCDEARLCERWQQRRLDLVPGLTCFWQVDGSRDDFAEWMRMDIRYSGRAWFLVDMNLLWRTLLKVVLHRASC